MDLLSLHLVYNHREGIRIAPMRIDVQSLCHIRLNINKHLSLGFLLLSFKFGFLFQDTSTSLVELLVVGLSTIFKVIFILIIVQLNSSLMALSDVV